MAHQAELMKVPTQQVLRLWQNGQCMHAKNYDQCVLYASTWPAGLVYLTQATYVFMQNCQIGLLQNNGR